MSTDTEEFWKGEFGDEYAKRNRGRTSNNIVFFSRALATAGVIKSIVEMGAGTGENLEALSKIHPNAQLLGVEINERAAMEISVGGVLRQSVLDYDPRQYGPCGLVLTKGFLIHVAPEDLLKVYNRLYESSSQYLLICEYYNPIPVEVEYRGHAGKLWKRDFAGELLEMYPDLCLVDYGFVYHKDSYPQDDITWFLLEKRG